MKIPESFPYREVLLHGKPEHMEDDFWVQHPRMEQGKRAKLFVPFDALDGYGDSLRAKNVVYEDRVYLSSEQQEGLNRALAMVSDRFAERNPLREGGGGLPRIRLTRYIPCSDPNNDACGKRGTYETVEGWLTAFDPILGRTLCINGERIPMDDIVVESRHIDVPAPI